MMKSILIVLILFFEIPRFTGKCIPECEKFAKKIVTCKQLKDGSTCVDCNRSSAVHWTFNSGPVPPNMCASEGILWATAQDTSPSLNSGTYECWANNSLESRRLIKTVNKTISSKTQPHPVLLEDYFNISCPTQFCAKSFTWTFARNLTGPYLKKLPPHVTTKGNKIIIKKMTNDAVGFYKCSVIPKDVTLPLSSRIFNIRLKQPKKITSSRFTNCERTVCATKSSTTQSHRCHGILTNEPPHMATIIFKCSSIGNVSSEVGVSKKVSKSEDRLTMQYSPQADRSFTLTVSVSNVNGDSNGTKCEVKVGRSLTFDARSFTLCLGEDYLLDWIVFGSGSGVILFVVMVIVLAACCQYQLWFCCRRVRYRLTCKNRTQDPKPQDPKPQIVLIYRHDKNAEMEAKETQTYLSGKLGPNIGCHLLRKGLAGLDPEDNEAPWRTVKEAHTVIVLLELASWDDELFKRALELSINETNQTRIYVCKRDTFKGAVESENQILINEVKAEITPACFHRSRRISWKKTSFNKKELLLRLRVVLPIAALDSTTQSHPQNEPLVSQAQE